MSVKKQIAIVITQIFLCTACFAQKGKIDSLKKVMPLLKDSARVDCLNELSGIYQYTQTDSALFYSYKALSESKSKQYQKGIADAFFNLANTYGQIGDYKSAEENIRLSISNYKKLSNADALARAYLWFGITLYAESNFQLATQAFLKANELFKYSKNIQGSNQTLFFLAFNYEESGLYEKAFELCTKSLNEAQKYNDQQFYFLSLLSVGRMYQNVEDYQTALDYYQQAWFFAEKQRLSSQFCTFCSLTMAAKMYAGEAYSCMGNFDSSKFYLDQVLASYEADERDSNARKESLMAVTEILGELYLRQKNYDKALEYFSEPMKFFAWGNNLTYLMRVLLNTGKAYAGKKKYSTALEYAKRLMSIAKKANARKYIRDGTGLIWDIYNQQGTVDSAYCFYQQYAEMKDSLLNARYVRQVALFKEKSENEKEQLKMQLALQKELLSKKVAFGVILIIILFAFILIRVITLKRKNEMHRRELVENELQLQKLESQKRLSELEMQALRAQMNPHFIFNSLNSINRFILQNNKAEATEYLTKFSRLIRMILNSSASATVGLAEDLEALQLYLELECLRFDNAFSYKLTCDPEVDADFIRVPPMLLQPFVENAIWHGLMNKKGKGNLWININQEDSTLICIITDDGIGRKKASELKSKSTSTHKSMGMRITADRIAMLQQKKQIDTTIQIRDLVLPDGSAGGTEVLLKIPVIE